MPCGFERGNGGLALKQLPRLVLGPDTQNTELYVKAAGRVTKKLPVQDDQLVAETTPRDCAIVSDGGRTRGSSDDASAAAAGPDGGLEG